MTELTKKFAIVIASDFKSYGHSKNTKNFKEVSVMMLIEDNIYIMKPYPIQHIILIMHSLSDGNWCIVTENIIGGGMR
jgi:hypothetical protein